MAFALTCRESGITASRRLGITNDVAAYEIDQAMAYALRKFEGKEFETRSKMIGYQVAKATWGDGSDSN